MFIHIHDYVGALFKVIPFAFRILEILGIKITSKLADKAILYVPA